jgi:hypothetical protein
MNTIETRLLKKIRSWVIFFIAALVLSGVTAFPIETELQFLISHLQIFPETIQQWLFKIYAAVSSTNRQFPYLSYGTDWLAFAHIVIAVAFIGVYKDPVRNIWIIEFGMIACVMVLPLAFIAGHIRQIPFFWQLIDCSFGIIGLISLWVCRKHIKALEQLQFPKFT